MLSSVDVVFTAPRRAATIEALVRDPGPREITLQTLVSLVSIGTESCCYAGEFDAGTSWAGWVRYPFRPGYSNVARVIKVGSDVHEFAEGDRVASLLPHQQYATIGVVDYRPMRLPDHASNDDATWCPLAVTTQTGVRHAEHAMGDSAVVVGLGPMGQLTVQYLRLMGLHEIIAIDTVQSRLDLALDHGATHAFCGAAAEAGKFVRGYTEDRLADVVYEITGSAGVFPEALKLVRDFGRMVLVGDSPNPSRQHLVQDLITRHLTIVGTHDSRLPPQHAHWTLHRQSLLFLEYILRGQMQVSALTTHRLSPLEVPGMYEAMLADRSGMMGVYLDWSQL